MAWFKRNKDNISPESKKLDIPDGQWVKCGGCGEIIHRKQFEDDLWTCYKCGFHERIGSDKYIKILLDEGSFRELDKKMTSGDPLEFEDTKKYSDRIKATIAKSGLNDAVKTGTGKVNGKRVAFACMDFKFIGGSMGSVVGEKISRAIDKAISGKMPMIIVSQSGGARMMEGAFSLMQMAKTSARLAKLDEMKLPYVSILTDPTTGGTSASYAMLGDINIAEPNALIGFAGPRVIKQTIGKDLPKGFQKTEFVQEKGFIDFIVDRKNLKERLSLSLEYMT